MLLWQIQSMRSRSSHQKSWLYKPQHSLSWLWKLEDYKAISRITPKNLLKKKKKKRRMGMSQLRTKNLSIGSSLIILSVTSLISPRTSFNPLWKIVTPSSWTLTQIFRTFRNGSMAASSILKSYSEGLKTDFSQISSGLNFIWRIIFSSWLKASTGRSLVGTHPVTYLRIYMESKISQISKPSCFS